MCSLETIANLLKLSDLVVKMSVKNPIDMPVTQANFNCLSRNNDKSFHFASTLAVLFDFKLTNDILGWKLSPVVFCY